MQLGVPVSMLDSAVTLHHGVEFATIEGFRPLLLDLYVPPPGTAAGAAIVYLHGGGWAVGTRRRFGRAFTDWSPTPLDRLAQAGFVVATRRAVVGIDDGRRPAANRPGAHARR